MSPLFIPTTYSGSCSRLIHPPVLNMSWQLTQHIAVRIIFTNTELFLPSLKATFRNQKFTNTLRKILSHILSLLHLIISLRQHLLPYFMDPKVRSWPFFITKVKTTVIMKSHEGGFLIKKFLWKQKTSRKMMCYSILLNEKMRWPSVQIQVN